MHGTIYYDLVCSGTMSINYQYNVLANMEVRVQKVA